MTEAIEEQDEVLKKGRNGWNGKCDDFRVIDNVVRIKKTDARPSHVPSEAQRQLTWDEEGKNFSQHIQLPPDDHLYQLWMFKIGPYLGDWVLGKGSHVSPPWKLRNFPDGYTLWLHKTGVSTDPANPRTDAYLHGAPHLGPTAGANRTHLSPTIFRSPMEFVEHAIWLMKGLEGKCLCKYCMPGQNQRAINRRLNRGLENDSDPESDDEDDNNNDAGAGAGNTNRPRRRRGRRDRTPPIMAKDYRVGNSGVVPPKERLLLVLSVESGLASFALRVA
ncbi:hypothetical protein BJV78DRAFT_1153994 [Lactifluus subvellereus]|nr:hypothetical protein BJV78DRAFT_1153994 [Lactifluus subvellereus]